MSVEDLLRKHFPSLDDEIFHYVSGVLESPEDFDSSEELYDAVGSVLLESLGADELEEEGAKVRGVCDQLYTVLCGGGDGDLGNVGEGAENADMAKLLDAPVHLASKLKDEDGDVASLSTIWMAQADSRTVVDQRKLEKVDAKLKSKLEKKALKDMEEEASSAVKNLSLAGPTTNQALSKQSMKAESGGAANTDVKIENFDIAFGSHVLLSDAELSLNYGRRYGLVGRNGVGKSTLLRSIANHELRLPSHVTVLHVEQEVIGDDTIALESLLECDVERAELLKREHQLLGNADRSPTSPIPPHQEGDHSELSKIYQRLHEIDADQAPARAATVLAGLGFSPAMQERPTREFSGGWRMRLALARALFAKPDLLLLDEPTNMLDLKAIMWLESYLQDWLSTMLVVSHDRTFLTNVCTDIIHMQSQRLTSYRGNYETFVQTKTERLRNQQREYEAQMQYRQHLQEFVDRWRYNAKRASQAQMRLKILEKLPDLKPVIADPDVILRFPEVEKLSPPILQLSEVTFSYTKDDLVFKNVNISANVDSRIAMVGENGAGKTTLLRLLQGELSPQDGYRTAHRNLRIAYFTQHHVDQLVMDVSALAFIQSKFPGKREEEYRQQLGSFGITGDLALRPIASLSGGQKSRLAFAILAMPRPNFMIFDEPTNHLDVETVEALSKAFRTFKGGVVLVSHDQHLIKACATEVWLCKDRTVYRLEGGLEQYRKAIEGEFSTTPRT